MRLPYATNGSVPVRSRGLYRIRVGDRSHQLEVPEPAALEGGQEQRAGDLGKKKVSFVKEVARVREDSLHALPSAE